jgi:uncharacterized protein YndB with AHSA1/START domain
MSPKPLEITPKGDREIVITRMFNASPAVIWRCHTEPGLVRRWLLGPPGWTMPVCEIDLRVGGTYRYEWAHADGRTMGMGGVYRAIDAPHKLVATQLFDEDWTGGETIGTLELLSVGAMKKSVQTITYASAEARETVLQSPMAGGMENSYRALDALLAEPM